MINPEDELPPIMVECPECHGACVIVVAEDDDGFFDSDDVEVCDVCHGVGEVEQDATDARDDALEARSHARREEGGRG